MMSFLFRSTVWSVLLILCIPLQAAKKLAVVKSARGNLKIGQIQSQVKAELKQAGIVRTGERIESGQDGKAVLRFFRDESFLEIRPRTVLEVKVGKSGQKMTRKISLKLGEVVFGIKKGVQDMEGETANSLVRGEGSRWSMAMSENAATTVIVLDGKVKLYNRPKDLTAEVKVGQKGVSDQNGIKITDATDEEMEQAGFRQNTLEVDFVNPQSEEFNTLEVEYETDF